MKLRMLFVSFFLITSVCQIYSQYKKSYITQKDLSDLFADLNMIGILGDDYRRIDIHFDKAKKDSEMEYKIKGYTRTRLSIICPFEGTVFIDSISFQPQLKSECTDIDGYVYGHYIFNESGDKRYSGSFSGLFKQAFRIVGRQMYKAVNVITELKLNLSEYVGEWKSNKGKTNICSWADEVIPNTPKDFCTFNDAGEWIVSPQYRKYGWENLYNAYYNYSIGQEEIQEARALEERKWWVEA